MFNLFQPFNAFIKLSDRVEKVIKKLMGDRFIDVALYTPYRMEKRVFYKRLNDIQEGDLSTLILTVQQHEFPTHRRQPVKIVLSDGFEHLYVQYFQGHRAYLKTKYPIGKKVLISGKIEKKSLFYTLSHPDFVGDEKDQKKWIGEQPIYSLTAGMNQNFIQRFVGQIVDKITMPDQWIAPNILAKLALSPICLSIQKMHQKEAFLPLSKNPYKKRLCFDEFLAHQLALILSSRKGQIVQQKQEEIIQTQEVSKLIQDFLNVLPFQLTAGQNKIIHDILSDMEKPYPMIRLLQGDVGSGKTMVAFITALQQIEKGYQVSLLSPTEILANQHYQNIQGLFGHKIRIELLTGQQTAKQKKQIYDRLKNHEIDLLIGTHALIQEKVNFHKLGYCIVDEQHRFGVKQRMLLQQKGSNVHLLSMTATPIPRTLTLAQYGDMDISLLTEKPKGRKPIVTTLLSHQKIDDLLNRLQEKLATDVQIYWVCPLIEDSENLSLMAVEKRYEELCDFFGEDKIALLHGKMKPSEKEHVMNMFKKGDKKILIATTVIEVGVDVPNASIMIIENAERFGLAQLHQLRGRVGRGSKESYCILIYGRQLTETGKKRLETMRQTDDGFYIAEMDLKLRGQGSITGTQQSGMPSFKFSDFEKSTPEEQDIYSALLEEANQYAWDLFLNPEYRVFFDHAYSYLLPIFKQDQAKNYTKTG